MKRIVLLLCSILVACSSGSSTDSEPNSPPSTPSLFYPTNNLFCIDSTIEFEFTAAIDPDGDAISYEIEFSTNSSFSVDVVVYATSSRINIYTLGTGQTYFWRVRAIDSRGLYGEYSDVYTFFTQSEGQVNNLPYTPVLIQPQINSTINSANINLQWSCIDIDGDQLVYDVYLDQNNPPQTLLLEDYSESSWSLTLENSTAYYWRVVAKDTNSAETIGQVWSFNTN
ncbi:MAG: hypothetical protein KJO22_07650 [Bacteroidia bacterium]|nr:hypothetical protein [Bacteroidia bacterium]